MIPPYKFGLGATVWNMSGLNFLIIIIILIIDIRSLNKLNE